jgi:ubiquinone biosynthesis protein
MLRARHFGRYKDIALLFTRYGLKDFTVRSSPEAAAEGGRRELEPDVAARAAAFAAELKRLGPAFVKFGQILSTRPDVVPPEYIAALESFQNRLEPFPFSDVKRIVEEELKGGLSELFASFDPSPLASASLGQVHRARARNGAELAVKVQRPGVREQAERDMAVFAEIAEALEARTRIGRTMNLVQTVRHLRQTLLSELNYLQEARNTMLLRAQLREFREILVPRVWADYTTARVIATDFMRGVKVSKAPRSALARAKSARLGPALFQAYLKQVCVDGFWHCDPHPGNVFLRGGRLALIDFGMTARVSGEAQDQISKFLLALTDNRGAAAADVCLKMGAPQEGFEKDDFVREVGEAVSAYYGAEPRLVSAGQLVFRIIGVANACSLRVPSELALLGKTLMHLDGIAKTLDPDMNPRAVIRGYAESLIAKKVRQRFHPRNFYGALLELNQFAMDLPRHARDFVEKLDEGRFSLNMKLNQGEDLLAGMQKIANRITVGLVIASMVVGSSMILSSGAPFDRGLFYALAISGYGGAVALAGYTILGTMQQDRRDRRRAMLKLKE